MSEELTINELKQKIKDSIAADIDKYVMPTKLERPTLSEYVKEQLSTEPELNFCLKGKDKWDII